MFKRLRWMTLGAVMGLAGSAWARLRLRRAASRRHPARVASRVGGELREALREGRVAMEEREAELRASLDQRTRPPRPVPAALPVKSALPVASRPHLTLVEEASAASVNRRRRALRR